MMSLRSPVLTLIFTRIGHTKQNTFVGSVWPRSPVSGSGCQRVSPLWAWHPGGLQPRELWPLGSRGGAPQSGEQDQAQDLSSWLSRPQVS